MNLWRCVWGMLNDLYWVYNLLLTGAKFAWWLGKSRGQGCLHTVQPVRNHLSSISEKAQNNFILHWMGVIKLHLWETSSKKELELYFPSLYVIKRSENDAERHKVERYLWEKQLQFLTSPWSMKMEKYYIDRNHESMGIFILESITASSSVFLLLRLFLYAFKYWKA